MSTKHHAWITALLPSHRPSQRACGQSGYVLISALLFLLIVTLISVTAMRTTALQQRMAGNLHDHQQAFRAAESALAAAETWLALQQDRNMGSTQPTTNEYVWTLDATTLAGMAMQPSIWWAAHGAQYPLLAQPASTQLLAEVTSPPHVVIQYARFARDSMNIGKQPRTGINYYRITAHGSGTSDESVAVIRSSYGKRFH